MRGETFDTFAKHFAIHVDASKKIEYHDLRRIMGFRILWSGNALALSRKFSCVDCGLCARERVAIFEKSYENVQLINSSSEIYGACRHRAKFHRFLSV